MITPLDRYLDELEGLLKKRVGKEAMIKMVDEIHAHLLMSKRDSIASGKSPEEAETLATEQFGDPTLVAADLIRQHTGVNTKSVWKLAKWPIILFALGSCASTLDIFSPVMPALWFQIYRFSMFLCLGAYVLVVIRSRRWLLMPMACVLLACSVLVSVSVSVWRDAGMPSTPTNSMVRQAVLAGNEQSLKTMRDELEYANRAYSAAQTGNPIPLGATYYVVSRGHRSQYPLVPYFNDTHLSTMMWGVALPFASEETAHLGPANDNQDVASVWKLNGSRTIRDMQNFNGKLSEWITERKNPNIAMAALTRFFGTSLKWIIANLSVLALINALLIWLAALSDRLRGRTLRGISQ